MKRLLAFLTFIAILAVTSCAQSRTNRIYRPCPSSTLQARVEVQADGDIDLVPCTGRDVRINGVATSNTLTVSGSSRTNFFPYFSTETNIAKSPFSWSGTAYVFNNTAENSEFTLSLTPSTAAGLFRVGDFSTTPTNYFQIIQAAGTAELAATGGIQLNSPLVTAAGNNVLSSANARLASGTTAVAAFNFNTGIVELGDIEINGGGTRLEIDDNGHQFSFNNTAGDAVMYLQSVQNYAMQRSITAGGTTGNRTINAPAGSVNFAAGTGTAGITVTSSITTTTSIVIAVARTNDTTCSVKNVVPAAGSFVIRMDANCTAETSVGFVVLN